MNLLNPWSATLAVCGVGSLCVLASWFDVRTGRIPNVLTYTAALTGIVFWLIVGVAIAIATKSEGQSLVSYAGWGLRISGVSLLVALVPAVFVVLLGGLGGGDMKLLAACGAWLASPAAVLDMAVVSLVVAAGMAVVIMVKKRIVKRTLAGVLGVGFLVAARVKPDLAERFPTTGPGSATVPFALAVAIGAGCAAAEHLLGLSLPWSHW